MKPLTAYFVALTTVSVSFATAPKISTPAPVFQPAPALSSDSGSASHPAEVSVQFILDPDGTTRDVLVTHSTNRQLEAPCRDAVARWRFEPASTQETEAASRMQTTFTFHQDRKISWKTTAR